MPCPLCYFKLPKGGSLRALAADVVPVGMLRLSFDDEARGALYISERSLHLLLRILIELLCLVELQEC